MTAHQAELIAAWRYDGDSSVYNLDSAQPLLDALGCYFSVVDGDRLIGFCCTGMAARVAGMTEEPGVLDLGMGMDPALAGQGHGAAFGAAVLSYLAAEHPDQTMRVAIQSWNGRSLRLARRLGFSVVSELIATQGGQAVTYHVLLK